MTDIAAGSITVLIVEDSRATADLLTRVLSSDPAIRVVGVATDAEQAVDAAKRLRPAVITMDVHMPHVDGLETTRRIMETSPTPIVMVSGAPATDSHDDGVHAVAAGALASVPQPAAADHPDHADSARRLIEMVKLMSEVKVVRRWPRRHAHGGGAVAAPAAPARLRAGVEVVAIGASTGGPLVLQSILANLPTRMPPVLIVQHMTPGFIQGFADWLTESTGFPVRLAGDGDAPQRGHAYVAPDGAHMGMRSDGRIVLSRQPPENGVRPAVSFLFRSLVDSLAPHVAAVLLTGMGRDGVDELKRLKEAGALTIAQDQQSSVVFGMPGQAVEARAASHVLSPDGIAAMLTSLVNPA